jgi:hypothetical protein
VIDEFIINGVTIHGGGQDQFWLSKVIGLDSPDVRLSQYDKPGEDGGVVSGAFYGRRPVTLIGRFQASNPSAYEDLRYVISRACAIQRDSRGYPQLIECRFTTLAGYTYFFYAQPGRPEFPDEHVNWADFMIPLTVPDPQIYGEGSVDSGFVTLPVASGVTSPMISPVIFGGVSGGTFTASNDGSLATWPVITLRGQLTNPYIVNATTGKVMKLNYTLSAGDFIKIYMGDTPEGKGKRIMLNDTSSLINAMDDSSEWFGIEPGDNLLSISSGSSGDNGTMEVFFYPAYAGI